MLFFYKLNDITHRPTLTVTSDNLFIKIQGARVSVVIYFLLLGGHQELSEGHVKCYESQPFLKMKIQIPQCLLCC